MSKLRALITREAVTTLVELLGLALVARGFALAWEPLGYIVGGAGVTGIGYLAAQPSKGDRS